MTTIRNPLNEPCPVWVSRRWWPWPKRYLAKAMMWGGSKEVRDLPPHVLLLILPDERKVFIDTTGRTIVYGRRAHEWALAQASQQAGQTLPIAS